MNGSLSLSTDQLAALVELSRRGSVRAAAAALHISEQGLRNRLLALEARFGVELYRKRRGPRRGTPLTEAGGRLLPRAAAVLEQADQLADLFAERAGPREVHVAASQYLIAYALIGVVRDFHAAEPAFRIRLSSRTEQEIDAELRHDPSLHLGVAAPYEASTELDYRHWFSLDWSLLARPGHRLLRRRRLTLSHVAEGPLILYERGSTGRAHVIEAFRGQGLDPRVEMEATNTDLIVRLVEAGLGISVVPLHPSGEVTRGHRVASRPLEGQVRPIDSGILTRKGEPLSEGARRFVEFCESAVLR